jgi:hypothetical protein
MGQTYKLDKIDFQYQKYILREGNCDTQSIYRGKYSFTGWDITLAKME